MLDADNFDENLPAVIKVVKSSRNSKGYFNSVIFVQVINKINQLSYKMFNDLPRGDQKCKSMRKLAGRTLIDVMPPKLLVYMESKFGDLAKVPDFYDMVGQLSYYGKMPEEIASV